MTQARYKIVFNGELMPDASLEATQENLARLFKSDLTRIHSLFIGKAIDLKRDLSENEADQYLKALQSAGAKVRKEQDFAASLSLVETDDHRAPDSEPASNVPMTCPKCGHQQAKAIECSACGIVIEKFIARQGQVNISSPTPPTPYRTPESPLNTATPPQSYAGFWYRALALFIDTILSTIIAIILIIPLAFSLSSSTAWNSAQQLETIGSMGNLFGWIVSWLYFTVFESSTWQATPGKKMLGLRATDLNGNKIGFGRANARYWLKILSALILLIGYIMAAFTEKKQALHDMIASTLVLKN